MSVFSKNREILQPRYAPVVEGANVQFTHQLDRNLLMGAPSECIVTKCHLK